MNILIVSNGHGESAIAGYLGSALLERAPGARVEHFPLVGEGGDPPPGLAVVGPRAQMPSGGLVAYWNLKNLARDISAGLLGLIGRQFAYLRRQGERDVIVAVGDVFCLAACLLFARRATVFVATAKSQYVASHSRLECAIARHARIAFARDAATAHSLSEHGVNARFAGNLMMDGVAVSKEPEARLQPLDSTALHVGVLPGSRDDAQANAAAAIRRVRLIAGMLAPRRLQALVSVAPGVLVQTVLDGIESSGVSVERMADGGCVAASGASDGLEVLAMNGCFGELLRASDIVLGQAGTGNEQAAGLGKPVIASSSALGGRLGWYRMRQQRLLGDALLVLPDDDREFASGVAALLADSARMLAMSRTGRERMGGPGGSKAVAEAVLALASESSV